MVANEISAKVQPQPRAMHNPQQYVNNLYINFIPQLKHLCEFFQIL